MKLIQRMTLVMGAISAVTVLGTACGSGDKSPTATAQPAAVMEKQDDGAAMPKTPEAMMDKTGDAMAMKLPEQRFAAHFVDSNPPHGAALDKTPEKIVINFNFTLGGKTGATVAKDGKAIVTMAGRISDNKLALEILVPGGSGDGLYTVDYDACWPDGSCHKGLFGFTVGDKAAMAVKEAMMEKSPDAMMPKTPEAMMDKGDAMMMLGEQRFAAHFVDSVPSHGEKFAASPNRIVINFDFTLGGGSTVRVSRDGQAVATPAAQVAGTRKLALETALPAGAGDGTYVVDYRACWPDGSCHDGQFGFVVDGGAAASYTDMSGRPEVALTMQNIAFSPATVIVSKGAKVTWTNRDPVVHFVNTDPHPTHNHTPDLNSQELAQNATYSFTFSQPGEYPYHCSAHTSMTARVLVKE
jgi:plastocyanin